MYDKVGSVFDAEEGTEIALDFAAGFFLCVLSVSKKEEVVATPVLSEAKNVLLSVEDALATFEKVSLSFVSKMDSLALVVSDAQEVSSPSLVAVVAVAASPLRS